MEEYIEDFKNSLVSEDEIINLLKTKSNPNEKLKINKLLLPEYTENGFNVTRELSKVYEVEKPKVHSKFFEDRVWTILAKMGFSQLNGKSLLKLKYSNEFNIPGRQIDVFASDEETVLVIECKSSEELRKKDLQTEINDFCLVKRGAINYIHKIYPHTKKKVKFILATNNIILSDQNKERLKSEDVQLFNENDILYFEELIKRLGVSSKYQLLGKIFRNQEIPELENSIPAIKGEMGGFTYYSFSIEPEKLLKISYILHRTDNSSDLVSYQRLVVKNRIKEITQFLDNPDTNGFFPNSIIVNISTKNEEPLKFDKIGNTHDSKITEPVILHLPKKYQSVFIIDGQHRLYGYAESKWKEKNSIPVVAFQNLPIEKQVDLFIQINSKQKPVGPNLLLDIVADQKWNSEDPKEAILSVKLKTLYELGKKDSSPFYKRIVENELTNTKKKCISPKNLLDYGFNKSEFFPKYKKDGSIISQGHLWVDPKVYGYVEVLKRTVDFFTQLFDIVKRECEEQWELGNDGLVATNIGIFLVTRVVDDILIYVRPNDSKEISQFSNNQLIEKIEPYLLIVLNEFNNFSSTKIKDTKSQGSSGSGMESTLREIQNFIHKVHPSFNPKNLDQWLKDNSGEFNESSKSITDNLEVRIGNYVIDYLKNKHGNRWWSDGINKEIQKICSERRIDGGNVEEPENYLDLIHLKKIIEEKDKWADLKNIFSDPQHGSSSKEDQIKWLQKINEIRKRFSHPRRSPVTESEMEFLSQTENWVLKKINQSK